jgi:hypothetical protein
LFNAFFKILEKLSDPEFVRELTADLAMNFGNKKTGYYLSFKFK